jgi:hypothetical protein
MIDFLAVDIHGTSGRYMHVFFHSMVAKSITVQSTQYISVSSIQYTTISFTSLKILRRTVVFLTICSMTDGN